MVKQYWKRLTNVVATQKRSGTVERPAADWANGPKLRQSDSSIHWPKKENYR